MKQIIIKHYPWLTFFFSRFFGFLFELWDFCLKLQNCTLVIQSTEGLLPSMNSTKNVYKEIYIKKNCQFSFSDLGTNSTEYLFVGTQGFNKNVDLASGRQFQYITKWWSFKICFYSGVEWKKKKKKKKPCKYFGKEFFAVSKHCFLNWIGLDFKFLFLFQWKWTLAAVENCSDPVTPLQNVANGKAL